MERLRFNFFGNTLLVPVSSPIAFSVEFSSSGTKHENYGTEDHFLVVKLKIQEFAQEQKIHLAKGTDGHGYSKPFRENLFRYVHRDICNICNKDGRRNDLPEARRKVITDYMMDTYEKGGDLTEEGLIDALISSYVKDASR